MLKMNLKKVLSVNIFLNSWFVLFTIFTLISCGAQNSQTKKSMNTFDIKTFKKNKSALNEYNFAIEPNISVVQSELKHVYTEDIIDKNTFFVLKNQYYKNGILKITGLYFKSSFRKGIWKEYDEQGHLIKETDYDKGFNYTWEDLLKFLKEREIKIIDRNTTI